jgi:hypothetical protein
VDDTDEDDSERIDLADCAKLLGGPLPLLWCRSNTRQVRIACGFEEQPAVLA